MYLTWAEISATPSYKLFVDVSIIYQFLLACAGVQLLMTQNYIESAERGLFRKGLAPECGACPLAVTMATPMRAPQFANPL